MIKQVTVTDLQRRAAKVISGLQEGPIVISQRGRPAAVIVTAEGYRAGRTLSQSTVARRVRAARRKK